jgi:hypothetical protein
VRGEVSLSLLLFYEAKSSALLGPVSSQWGGPSPGSSQKRFLVQRARIVNDPLQRSSRETVVGTFAAHLLSEPLLPIRVHLLLPLFGRENVHLRDHRL